MFISKELKETICKFVADDRREQAYADEALGNPFDEGYFPIELALPKKDFLKDFKSNNFKTDCLEQDDFIIDFKDLKKIILEEV